MLESFTPEQRDALQLLLADWIDDSYTRGIDCGDVTVRRQYLLTRETLKPLFDALGPWWFPDGHTSYCGFCGMETPSGVECLDPDSPEGCDCATSCAVCGSRKCTD